MIDNVFVHIQETNMSTKKQGFDDMRQEIIERPFSEYLTVREAASVLGVSPSTLRNWDRTGKLRAIRHPLNGYRIYLKNELERILRDVLHREGGPDNATRS